MTDCQHCHKPMKPATANLLCASCREDYWTLIRQLGHVQLPALRSIMLRQARIGTPAHTPSRGNAPMPIDTHAQDLIADSEAWLAEQAGKIRAAYAAYDWRKAWYAIISNKHTILTMSTAADDYAALEHIIRRNEEASLLCYNHLRSGTCQALVGKSCFNPCFAEYIVFVEISAEAIPRDGLIEIVGLLHTLITAAYCIEEYVLVDTASGVYLAIKGPCYATGKGHLTAFNRLRCSHTRPLSGSNIHAAPRGMHFALGAIDKESAPNIKLSIERSGYGLHSG